MQLTSIATIVAVASAVNAVSFDTTDSAGYYLPSSGVASTTQFLLGPELSGGTACGVSSLPSGSASGTIGSGSNGPGYLYAAINQLAFGANPSASAGGAGGACGICYQITPVNSAGSALSANALTFMIVDECPAAAALSGGNNCNQCSTSATSSTFGTHWTFDIAIDAMSSSQYKTFYNGVTDGSNWLKVNFQHVSCGSANTKPAIKSWGCISGGCSNNDAAKVCANV